MCPLCMTNAVVMVAGATSGAGVLGFLAVKVRALRRHRRTPRTAQLASKKSKQSVNQHGHQQLRIRREV